MERDFSKFADAVIANAREGVRLERKVLEWKLAEAAAKPDERDIPKPR